MTHRSNPAEEIQAAIDKLTKLKAESDQPTHGATWVMEKEGEYTTSIFTGPLSQISRDIATYVVTDNARLIVTLHRTIDAQLAILKSAFDDADGSHDEPGAFDLALNLARAINGGA